MLDVFQPEPDICYQTKLFFRKNYLKSLMMELEDYNKSFEDYLETFDEDINYKLRSIRQQCYRDFVERFNNRQKEWDRTFRELLKKSQEDDNSVKKSIDLKPPNGTGLDKLAGGIDLNLSLPNPELTPFSTKTKEVFEHDGNLKENSPNIVDQKPTSLEPIRVLKPSSKSETKEPQQIKPDSKSISKEDKEFTDLNFSNNSAIKEFSRIQNVLESSREAFNELNTNSGLRQFKTQLNLFIRTQINSISNSDSQHINTKTKLLTNLFTGQKVNFQDRIIDASQHPQGCLFSMDLAAQTFVTVGTRLVNSVPAIAKSMATVINGIINNDLTLFKDLILGHLLERCPYLIPLNPRLNDIPEGNDREMNFKIACGYCIDIKTQSLESEEKYLARMRSMALIYACILVQEHKHQAWSWLASFLSLKPQPVITATILQAFLQESSKELSTTYGCQYKKLITFIRGCYLKMIEEATLGDKQSFIKLKNLLSDDSGLIATPKMSSIFGAIRMG